MGFSGIMIFVRLTVDRHLSLDIYKILYVPCVILNYFGSLGISTLIIVGVQSVLGYIRKWCKLRDSSNSLNSSEKSSNNTAESQCKTLADPKREVLESNIGWAFEGGTCTVHRDLCIFYGFCNMIYLVAPDVITVV